MNGRNALTRMIRIMLTKEGDPGNQAHLAQIDVFMESIEMALVGMLMVPDTYMPTPNYEEGLALFREAIADIEGWVEERRPAQRTDTEVN